MYTGSEDNNNSDIGRFDSDSIAIRIDNCCSRSLSFDKLVFMEGTLRELETKTIIKGFGDSETPINQIGTLRWLIDDDSGVTREIIIPNSYYIPEAGVRLLSPQHWAQETDEVFNEGTVCFTYGNKIKLLWNNQRYCRTIFINKAGCNTGILWTKPSFN